MYKDPLGPDEDPEILLKYRASPRTILLGDHGTPKSHKKVRIQEEIEIKEAEKYIKDLECEDELDKLDSDEFEGPELKETCLDDPDEPSTSDVKAPQGILKRSQQKLYDTFKPHSSSLKKKFNNPITKIKKMADKQFKKVKPTKGIKTITIAKNEIVLEDPQKILKLKESPKSRNREITSYIVKQDSDDTVEITNLDESPTETRKKRDVEDTTVVPDEIIELPVLKEEDHTESVENDHSVSVVPEKVPEEVMEVIEEIPTEKKEAPETESDSQVNIISYAQILFYFYHFVLT